MHTNFMQMARRVYALVNRKAGGTAEDIARDLGVGPGSPAFNGSCPLTLAWMKRENESLGEQHFPSRTPKVLIDGSYPPPLSMVCISS